MRGHLHIPDMLLICAAKREVREGKHDGDFEAALEYAGKTSHYDKERWTDKFKHENILTKFNRLRPDSKLTQNSDNSGMMGNVDAKEKPVMPWETLQVDAGDQNINPWIEALKAWVDFLKPDS